MENLVVLTLER